MKRALLVLLGLFVAVVGAALLAGSVDEARQEAASAIPNVEVLVVRTAVPRLSPLEDVAAAVALVPIPETAVVPGALTTLDGIDADHVTTADLLPGEQVLAARFSAPQTVERLEVPDGLQEVTLAIPSSRALGGSIVVGEEVGVVGSFANEAAGGSVTDFVLNRALVTAVQFSGDDVAQVEQDATNGGGVPVALEGTVLVTFALSGDDASALVFTAEFGSIWLTRQGEAADVGGGGSVSLDSVFSGAP